METSNAEHLPAQVQNNSSSMVEWTTLPANTEMEVKEGLDTSTILHSLRRHWLLSAVLGVIIGTAITASCIIFLPKTYTARAMIKVDMSPEDNPIGNRRGYNRSDYEIFKNTQALSIRSPFVLNKALRVKEVLDSTIYQREEKNPVRWLQENLVVTYPKNAELMEVSLSDTDKTEVTTIVSAIVAAYMEEVVERAKRKSRIELATLEKVFAEKKTDARTKRNELKQIAKRMNTTDTNALSIEQLAETQEHRELRNSLRILRRECLKSEMELAAAEAKLSSLTTEGVSEFELMPVLNQDRECANYQRTMAGLDTIVKEQEAVARSSTMNNSITGQFARQYESAKASFEERKAELEKQLFASQEHVLKAAVGEIKLQKEMLDNERTVIKDQFKESSKLIAKLGRTSVEIEIRRAELKSLDSILTKLNTQLEQKRYELRNDSRITVRQDPQDPKSHDAPQLRISLAIVAGFFGAIFPLLMIVMVDIQKKRINGPEDVKKNIGIPIIGSVPVIPSRAIRQLNAPKGAGHLWNMRLTESIDSISARLLRSALLEQERVVLITSAVSGEGKTTLAVQIAMSLARAGKRTVLVDFDLRRPAIDKAFQLPLDPGISEALCGESDIRELAQSVGIDHLDVITTGRCDRHVLQALANGEDARILSQLKNKYDFVIVDGSPILPVADSRYIAQHVDSVVMSVFRDLSRTPKVLSAYNILKSFGVENIEAVIASPCDAGYGTIHTTTDKQSGTA